MEIKPQTKGMARNLAFQLGHVLSDMEIKPQTKGMARNLAFQLGHVLSDMEIDKRYRIKLWNKEVSIGPRPFRHGNARDAQEALLASLVSIGPRPFRHGNKG